MVSRWRWAWGHAGSIWREIGASVVASVIWLALAKHYGWGDVTPEIGALVAAVMGAVLMWTAELAWHFSRSRIVQERRHLADCLEAQRLPVPVPKLPSTDLVVGLLSDRLPMSPRRSCRLTVTNVGPVTAENVQVSLVDVEPAPGWQRRYPVYLAPERGESDRGASMNPGDEER
jgi:hypothetical protein